ncbi:MAG: ABC transporter substrate-binding protein [Pseudonocardiaceae bacterium]
MVRSRRYLRIVATMVAAAALGTVWASACTGPSDAGKVTVLCGATEKWCAAQTQAFTHDTGIEADFVRLSNGEAVARLEAGKASPEFDVWHGGPADGYVAAANKGLLEPYVSPRAQVIRPEWKSADGSWTGVYIGVLGFCSNQKDLREHGQQPPTSWMDLLDPRYRENISVAHPSTSGTGYTALWTQVMLANGDQNKAFAYLSALRPNILQFTKSGIGPLQQVGRGEIGTAIMFSHDCVTTREEGFTDLVISFPREGTGYEVGGVAVVRGARNLAAAKAYVDWALTAKAQEIGPTVRSYQVPTNPAAKVSDFSVRLDQLRLVPYDFAAAGKAKPTLVTRFNDVVAPPTQQR